MIARCQGSGLSTTLEHVNDETESRRGAKMTVDWLMSDLNKAEATYRQQEIRRSMELARARELERASKPRRKLFGRRAARAERR